MIGIQKSKSIPILNDLIAINEQEILKRSKSANNIDDINQNSETQEIAFNNLFSKKEVKSDMNCDFELKLSNARIKKIDEEIEDLTEKEKIKSKFDFDAEDHIFPQKQGENFDEDLYFIEERSKNLIDIKLPTPDEFIKLAKSEGVDYNIIIDILLLHNNKFYFDFDSKKYFGFMEKEELEEKTTIVCHGDIHGSLEDLLKYFEGEFKGNNVRKIFLGDIMDRGKEGLFCHVYLALLRLHGYNVRELRGNHEYIDLNERYGADDQLLQFFLSNKYTCALLNYYFKSLPFSLFVRQKHKSNTNEEEITWLLFTHGAIDPTLDLGPFFQGNDKIFKVPKKTELTLRYQQIAENIEEYYSKWKEENNLKDEDTKAMNFKKSLDTIKKFIESEKKYGRNENLCSIPWGDIGESTYLNGNCLGLRYWSVSFKDLRLWMIFFNIFFLLKGHKHLPEFFKDGEKVFAVTLPVAKTPYYSKRWPNLLDFCYLINTHEDYKKWTKKVFLNEYGWENVKEVPGGEVSLYSNDADLLEQTMIEFKSENNNKTN